MKGERLPTSQALAGDLADIIESRSALGGLAVSAGRRSGYIVVDKFGNNPDVDAAEDIWNGGGDYMGFPTSGVAETVQVFSSSAADASAGTGARTCTIYGLGSAWQIQQEAITLNGTTPVVSTQTWQRVNRCIINTAGSGGANAGIITCRHSTTTANVFLAMPAGMNQTLVAAYTIPAGYTGYRYRLSSECIDSTANSAKMALLVRPFGGVFNTKRVFMVSSNYRYEEDLVFPAVYAEKTDIKVRCTSVQNANADITAHFVILLVPN